MIDSDRICLIVFDLNSLLLVPCDRLSWVSVSYSADARHFYGIVNCIRSLYNKSLQWVACYWHHWVNVNCPYLVHSSDDTGSRLTSRTSRPDRFFWASPFYVFSFFIIMVALCNRADHNIFMLFLLSSSFFFFISSPNLSGRRLDVYHTLAHGVALVRI